MLRVWPYTTLKRIGVYKMFYSVTNINKSFSHEKAKDYFLCISRPKKVDSKKYQLTNKEIISGEGCGHNCSGSYWRECFH